jgi:hypothetical protein
MSKQQYLKILENEIHMTNKRIDAKIMRGDDYRKEALEHKQLLHKIRQHRRRGFFGNFLNLLNRLPQFSNL